MKPQHFIIAIFISLTVSLVLSLTYAPREIQDLELYKDALEKNTQSLLQRSGQLEALYYQLRDDPQVLITEANRIGMIFPGDTMIQVHPRERRVNAQSPGERVLIVKPSIQAETLFRSISVSMALLFIFIRLAISHRGRQPQSTEKQEADNQSVNKVGSVGNAIKAV